VILVAGVMTRVMAGACALFERDAKKVVAFSTMRQLGVIVYSIGLGLVTFSLFHLFMHAAFKALLFLCAGEFIHNMSGYQDFRVYGGLLGYFPFRVSVLAGSLFSMAGFVFFSGFYSKDQVWETFYFSGVWGQILVALIFITIVLTVAYSVRFFIGVLFSDVGSHPYVSVGGWDRFIVVSMVGLFGLSVFGGAVFVNFVDGLIGGPVSLRYQDKLLLIESALFGVSLYLSVRLLALARGVASYVVSSAMYNMWFLVSLSSQPLVYLYFTVTSAIKAVFDSGWFELFGGLGGYNLVMSVSSSVSRYHTSFFF